jgi:N-acyl-D-amino-acid deacylase
VLPLEAAVQRLTLLPATVHGLAGRGAIRAGWAADLVVYDPARLGVGTTRLARDFPAGSARYVVDAIGYRAVIVNGVPVLEDGRPTGALPGQVLRG